MSDRTADAVAATGLTRFQIDLLAAIGKYEPEKLADVDPAGDDYPHGLAIKDLLDQRYETDVHHGRLYPNLDDLVELRLVDKVQIDRRTNGYRLTDSGREYLTQRAAWTDPDSNGDAA